MGSTSEPLDQIRDHFSQSIATKQKVAEQCAESIQAAAELITRCFSTKNKLLICGNGGSAADSQHMAAEFTSRLTKEFERPSLPALALTTDTSFLTAYANDCGYEGVFARQIEGLGRPDDVLLGITTSGNSPNVLAGAEQARKNGMPVIALTGEGGGKMEPLADVTIAVPSRDTQYIQESHLAIEHIICALVEQSLFGTS